MPSRHVRLHGSWLHAGKLAFNETMPSAHVPRGHAEINASPEIQTPFVAARRFQAIKRHIFHVLRLDVVHLSPFDSATIYQFRRTHGQTPPAYTPHHLRDAVGGNLAAAVVPQLFPRAVVHIQLDLETHSIRWSRTHFISLHTVRSFAQSRVAKSNKRRSWDGSGSLLFNRSGQKRCKGHTQTTGKSQPEKKWTLARRASHSSYLNLANLPAINITFSDRYGQPRLLLAHMPAHLVSSWFRTLQDVLSSIPYSAPPAHWYWTLCCMVATSQRGATGFLRTSDLTVLLRCANGGPSIGPELLAATLQAMEESEQRLGLDAWLSSAANKRSSMRSNRNNSSSTATSGLGFLGVQMLNVRQVSGLLLRLCISSPAVDELFDQYAFKACMGAEEWLSFDRERQLTADESAESRVEDEMSKAAATFETAVTCTMLARPDNLAAALQQAENSSLMIDKIQFAQQLLCPANDVVPPQQDRHKDQPLAHYWTACSHNSYAIRDRT